MTRAMAPSADEIGSVGWMTTILAKLRKHPDAPPFLKPVDWKRLGLNDYLKVIKTPMDLQTAGRLCRDGQYSSVDTFKSDIMRIWENCRTYNGSDSDIAIMADRMEAYANELFAETTDQIAPAATSAVAGDEEEMSKSKRRRRTTLATVANPTEESDSNALTQSISRSSRGRPPNSRSRREPPSTRSVGDSVAHEAPATSLVTDTTNGGVPSYITEPTAAGDLLLPQPVDPIEVSQPPLQLTDEQPQLTGAGEELMIVENQDAAPAFEDVGPAMTEQRLRLLQKFTERVARLNPKNMYYFLTTIREEWLSRPTPHKVELDLTQIDDENISNLTSVCKCLLYYQTVSS